MSTIPIGPDWRARADALNWALERRAVREKGKHAGEEYWEGVGWYSSLPALYTALLRHEVRRADTEGLRAVMERLDAAERWAQAAVRGAQ